MSFPTALSSTATDYLATMQFNTDCYLLVWEQNIVFHALVNQSSFENTYATITWDGLVSGAYADALEGYTVWISATDDIRDSKWWGRLRSVATATTLSVEWNSYQPSDNDHIFVTKDIRESTKTPYLDGSTWKADYDISYRAPPPIIYGIPTFITEVLNSAGTAEITITPGAYAIGSGKSISSWALTSTDGGTQVSFNATTGAAVIRYDSPGDYMPRLTVTDDGGQTQWFSLYVKIIPADLSSIVNLKFSDISINATIDNGWNMTMPFWDGVENVLDGSMCAVYMPHKTAGNQLMMCGRIRTEDTDFTANDSGTASFNVDGLAQIMNNINTITWRYKDTDSPDDFSEITTLTLWRAVGAYIHEMTNINNTHSLVLDDVTDDYRYLSYFFQKGTLLDSLRGQMWSINADFEFTSDGMFKLVRNARYIPTADRAALTTIANLKLKHYGGNSIDDVMYSLEKDHSWQVGKAITGNGYYNTTSGDVSFFSALSPPVQPARGTESSTTDRQILKANLSRAGAETEGKQRARNDFAAKQRLDTIRVQLPGGFLGKLNPSISQFYTHTIELADGIRRLDYDTNDKWLLTDLEVGYDIVLGQTVLDATFQIESDDLGFSISIRDPIPTTAYDVPVMMPLSAFPTFDYDPAIDFPTGVADGDEQPVNQEDANPVAGAQDPATMITYNNSTVVVWNETRVFMTREFGKPSPVWFEITPGSLPSGHKIQQFAWDREAVGGTGGYVIAHNDTIADPDTRVYYKENVGNMADWQETTLTDMLATMVNVTGDEEVVVYGKYKDYAPAGGFPLSGLAYYSGTNDMSGDGTPDLLPSSQPSAVGGPYSSLPGTYNTVTETFFGGVGDEGGVACDIKWAIPPGVTITSISIRFSYNRPLTTSEGDTVIYIQSDTLQHAGISGSSVASGNHTNSLIPASANIPIAAGTQSYLYFHAGIGKKQSDGAYVNITGISIGGTVEADWVATRYSTDKAETFEAAVGIGVMTLGDGSFTRRKGQRVLGAMDETIKRAPLAGQSFLFTADQGATAVGAGRYATALMKFGKDDDYLVALDATTGLQKVVNDALTDITPNDGANDGFAISVGSLAMTSIDDDYIWMLGNFGGSVKLAYSTDLGTNWSFNANTTSNANWVSVNPRGTTVIYIADDATIWRSIDGGANIASYSAPISSLIGVEPL